MLEVVNIADLERWTIATLKTYFSYENCNLSDKQAKTLINTDLLDNLIIAMIKAHEVKIKEVYPVSDIKSIYSKVISEQ